MRLYTNNICLTIDERSGEMISLLLGNKECCFAPCPVFVMRMRDTDGGASYVEPKMAETVRVCENELLFEGFLPKFPTLCVKIIVEADDGICWTANVSGVPCDYAVEWIELAKICVPRLIDNDKNGGKLLFPFNEGVLISDETKFKRHEPEFPSSGAHPMFPNTVCSQFMAYLFDDRGLYIGAHDKKRGSKCVDFYPLNGGLCLNMRLYSGCEFGMDYVQKFPIVWKSCSGKWQSAADIYRDWFEKNPPAGALKIKDNKSLPNWYEDSPLIVTYPVRGVHDMDKMEPNSLFPYTNALPILERIKSDTGSRIMALLMHWEGTAPWAPPYVWPPFGGVECFNKFRDELHKGGNLLGVYCSGFGYTLRSTIADYDCEERIKKENVLECVCHSPKNKPELGIICSPYQRFGYDICPASLRGRKILDEAYSPLFKSGIDYAQILDQNHGGGQCLCYARSHFHAPMPGEWMTENMTGLLTNWRRLSDNMVFGCESASSEPFIGNLLMSDNRYELNYSVGTPTPVYAYIYHEYVRNFMGNQVGCPFDTHIDTLRYRLAYSFSIGDLMTLVLSPLGGLMTHWGMRDFDSCPDMELTLKFIGNMTKFYKERAKKYLYCGKMMSNERFECEDIYIPMTNGRGESKLPRLLCSAWTKESDGCAYIVINPENEPVRFKLGGKEYIAQPLDAVLIEE